MFWCSEVPEVTYLLHYIKRKTFELNRHQIKQTTL